MSDAAHRTSFFKQSGWLMIANIASGALMWGVHFLSKKIPPEEYAVFGTLLAVIMCIPAMPLQMVYAQQTAAALATGRERQLAAMIRLGWMGTTLVWIVGAVAMLVLQEGLAERWKVSNSAALWILMAVILLSFWLPMFLGVLQGRQNFFWLGWAMMLNGIGRLGGSAFVVFVLAGLAAGMMGGVVAGLALAVAIGIWHSRDLWGGPAETIDRRAWLRQIVPLVLGSGACQFLFTADTMFVNAYFTADQTAPYVVAGTLSRALMWLVGPLVAVMFPKIVRSAARSEKTDLLRPVLLGTAVLCGVGAVGLCVLGPFVVRFVSKPEYVPNAVAMLPWYAGAMVPLSLANVLVNNLLAHARLRIVPWLVLLAAGYGVSLTFIRSSPVAVLQILGSFNLLLLATSAWFTFHHSRSTNSETQSAA
jgi:O-antigen/teichoic acid export membrane protein